MFILKRRLIHFLFEHGKIFIEFFNLRFRQNSVKKILLSCLILKCSVIMFYMKTRRVLPWTRWKIYKLLIPRVLKKLSRRIKKPMRLWMRWEANSTSFRLWRPRIFVWRRRTWNCGELLILWSIDNDYLNCLKIFERLNLHVQRMVSVHPDLAFNSMFPWESGSCWID